MAKSNFTMGIDFGTNSVRALIADVQTGAEIATAVVPFVRGEQGVISDPKNGLVARQHPKDWLEAMAKAGKNAVAKARKKRGFQPELVIGIGVAATASTPVPLDRQCTPLAMHKEFSGNLNAMAWLWKDHSSFGEARELTELARQLNPHYLARIGGAYSSEWFWAKILRCLRVDKKVFNAAHAWAECSDLIPAVLTGVTDPALMLRNACAAGHKDWYNDAWGGYPEKTFLEILHADLADLRDRLVPNVVTSGQKAGGLCPEWAAKFGLPAKTVVAAGAIDAHLGAVGSAIKPGVLVKIIGTSTCDMMVAPKQKPLPDIPGISGIVDGSIIPGMWGLEAGQSAVGDIFNWFVAEIGPHNMSHDQLTREAKKLRPGQSGLIALDWNNGNRSVLLDPRLSGLLAGQTLHTRPAEIYRALIEATAFGALMILDRVEECGVKVKEVVNCGGISEKNELLLQIQADVMGRPMKVARSSQTVALGACIMAAAAAGKRAGGHASVASAQRAMAGLKAKVFRPIPKNVKTYGRLFALYRQLHDSFGGMNPQADLGQVMKQLMEIRESTTRES